MKTILFLVGVIGVMGLVAAIAIAPALAYSEKSPQAECIKGQNQAFVGKEQSGEAYQFSKDSCQTLSK